MVLYVQKYDIDPDKAEAFAKWAEDAIKRSLAVPGVVEFRAYRTALGTSQIVVTYEFADMGVWATWFNSEEGQKLWEELHTLALNISTELWGPSPVVPAPIRPGK